MKIKINGNKNHGSLCDICHKYIQDTTVMIDTKNNGLHNIVTCIPCFRQIDDTISSVINIIDHIDDFKEHKKEG